MKIVHCFILNLILVCAIGACQLGGPRPTVCSAYASADVVILGTVVGSEEGGAKIQVERAYKGKAPSSVILEQRGTSCARDYQSAVGKTLLLYLYSRKDSSMFHEGGHFSGGEIGKVQDDLRWLDQLPISLSRTRISGFLSMKMTESVEESVPLADTPVKLTSKDNAYTIVSDKSGFFQIWDIPAGDYRIEPGMAADAYSIDHWSPFGRGFISGLASIDGKTPLEYSLSIDPRSERCGRIDYLFRRRNK